MRSIASHLSTIKVYSPPYANTLGCGQSVLTILRRAKVYSVTRDVGMQAACQVTAFARDSRGDGHAYAWQLLGTSHGSTLRSLAVEVSSCLSVVPSRFLLSLVASLDAQSMDSWPSCKTSLCRAVSGC